MTLNFLIILISLFFVSHWFGTINILLSLVFDLVDKPDGDRKLQKSPVPLAGITLSLLLATAVSTSLFFENEFWGRLNIISNLELTKNIDNPVNWWWVVAGIIIILIGGLIDDKNNLKSWQLAIPINVGLLAIVFGGNLRIEALSYPFDTIIPSFGFLHQFLAWVWLGLCLATTKFLDGHDGLVSSVGIINFMVIAFMAFLPSINQPLIWSICLVWIACIAGFLPYNLPNAQSYIGEGASELIGLMIGILSILSGAKLATSFSIVGWFLLDLMLVLFIRYKNGKNILQAGREHWHFRLLDYGFSKWQVLIMSIILISFTGFFGAVLPTVYKPIIILFELVILLGIFKVTSRK